jgi:hypothetical protein
MRHQIQKLIKGKSTKAERRMVELLKKYRIPFRAKIKIQGREIDFLIGKYAIEIDGHLQSVSKNEQLVKAGYVPIHLSNWVINSDLEPWLKNICHIQE